MVINNVKVVRESLLMSKAELARKANLSPLTVARIEAGHECRVETMRKILLAMGFEVSEKEKLFPE